MGSYSGAEDYEKDSVIVVLLWQKLCRRHRLKIRKTHLRGMGERICSHFYKFFELAIPSLVFG